MPQYYQYKNYSEYVEVQRGRARKSKGVTRDKYVGRRHYIYSRMKELNIKGNNLLALGARDNSELVFFEGLGYAVDGIDLLGTDKIIPCDMSKIHRHPYFKDKKYDVVFSSDSMEHCLDLEGFVTGLNQVCSYYFVCMCPVTGPNPSKWDCSNHLFMEGIDDKGTYDRNLRQCFPEFDIVINEIHKKGKRLFFILKKKDCKA